MKLWISFGIIAAILISGCTQNTNNTQSNSQNSQNISEAINISATPADIARDACNNYCRQLLSRGADISSGPCILNPIPNMDWVCDVAHLPRQDEDNLPQNQCSEYLNTANHFVEVTQNCEFIRAI